MKCSTFVAAHLAFLFVVLPLLAQPVVSGASSASVTHRQTGVVISGSNFGTKDTPPPLQWDDFEDGVLGETVIGKNGWTTMLLDGQYEDVVYTDVNQRPGSARSTLNDLTNTSPSFGITGTWTEIYATYWVRHHMTVMGYPGNLKEFKIYGNLNSNTNPECGVEGWVLPPSTTNLSLRLQAGVLPDVNAVLGKLSTGLQFYVNDEWVRREVWLRVTDAEVQALKIAENCVVRFDYPTPGDWPYGWYVDPETGEQKEWTGATLGAYMGDWDGRLRATWFLCFIRSGSEGYSQFDDVYIDTTQARVEIGDAATWAGCTHREIQIPSAWSDTAIEFTVNQGSFQNGAKAYLYVVDADGKMNAENFPISFSTSERPATGVPGKPTPEGAVASSAR